MDASDVAGRSGGASSSLSSPSWGGEASPLGPVTSTTLAPTTYRALGLTVTPLSADETAAARREPIGMLGWTAPEGRAAALYQRFSLGRVLGLVAREAVAGG